MEKLIKLKNADAYWKRNSNLNNWDLIHEHFELAGYRNRKFDGLVVDIYGWVDELTSGENKGKYESSCPISYDEETGSDCYIIGVFDTVEKAMEAVEEINPPINGYCL